jgi:hypothetical protein
MEEIFNYTDEKLHNLDKNILVDTLKHTSDIMTALSNKVCVMEEEIKNIQEQLFSLSKLILDKSNNSHKESSNNFKELYKTNQNIDIIYDNENNNENNNNLNNIKQETKDIIKKEEIPGNIINNRKKNNLFIRNI